MQKNNNIAEKLPLQETSFRETFDKLLKAQNLKELTIYFADLLRENFIIREINIYHKVSIAASWDILFAEDKDSKHDLLLLENKNIYNINYYDNLDYSASVVLPLQDSTKLGMLLGNKANGNTFTDYDKITLQIILQIFNSAYSSIVTQRKEKELMFELNEKVFQLNHLINTGIEISRFENRGRLFELALESISSLTNASAAAFRISNPGVNTEQVYVFPPGTAYENIITSELNTETLFNFGDRQYHLILSGKEMRTGLTSFNELDKLLLQAVTRQVSAAIENEYLHQQSVDKEIIEKEISLAASIQQRIIPRELPHINGYDAAAINIPSKEIGGDYYDFIMLSSGKAALVIADVAGKGISAALLVNTLNASLYTYLEFNLPLTEITDRLNKIIYRASPQDKYITFFIALLDPATGEVETVNAGHNPILLLRSSGLLEKLEAGGIGLGMFDMGLLYTGQNIKLEAGDRLFMYTDGIPEAMNNNQEEFTDEKMIDFLLKNSAKHVQVFLNDLVSEVKTFAGSAEQSDDITMLILEKK
jgi:sigma-B regulation protein RsbU (phosphoserine phosphatase)